jgi:glucose dehydrogenase
VDAQPLYIHQLVIGGTAHNVVYVATEHNSVYAFDADTGAQLWKRSVLPAGEDLSDTHGCDQVTPEIGITSTPVIDRDAGANGAIYVVAMSRSDSTYHQRLHALDLTTGAPLVTAREITASYSWAGNTTTFDPKQYEERAALLLVNGVIYTTWTSHCDQPPYTGWVIAFDQNTLDRRAAIDLAVGSGGVGPAIWMAGGGPAADADGNVYLLTANGAFETTLVNGFPSKGDYGNSFVKLTLNGSTLSVNDYFTVSNTIAASAADRDLGSGGGMLLPDLTDSSGVTRRLMVGAGKDGNIYVVNRDSMGHFSSTANNIWQQLSGALSGVFSTPAYFNGTLYYGSINQPIRAFKITNARVQSSTLQTFTSFQYPGTSPVVSANGTSNGIVWAHVNLSNASLRAFDAVSLDDLYDSDLVANGRDRIGAGNKFITPTVIDGKVFLGSQNAVGVFGLLP